MALSDTWLRTNHKKISDKKRVVSDRDGLSVRISPKGKIVFQIRYRHNKKSDQVDLGAYPIITLKSAREKVLHLNKVMLEEGIDPKSALRMESKAKIADVQLTLSGLTQLWYEKDLKHRITNHKQIYKDFQKHLFPVLGDYPLSKISINQWLDILETLAKDIPTTTNNLLIYTKQLFRWSLKRELVDKNPLSDFTPRDLGIKKNVGQRILSDQEIYFIWNALSGKQFYRASKVTFGVKLCLFFGCRIGELRLSKKEDFDFDKMIWVIPPENHKTGRVEKEPIIRPFINEVIPLLDLLFALYPNSPLLFPKNDDMHSYMEKSFHTQWPANINRWVKDTFEEDMLDWSIKALRKTARTNFATLTEPHVAELMLGHKLPGVWQVYDKYKYIEEQRKAYQAWWSRIMKITRIE